MDIKKLWIVALMLARIEFQKWNSQHGIPPNLHANQIFSYQNLRQIISHITQIFRIAFLMEVRYLIFVIRVRSLSPGNLSGASPQEPGERSLMGMETLLHTHVEA